MQILERIISIVAPHDCLACGLEGAVLCADCQGLFPPSLPSRCYICRKLTSGSRVCQSCRHKSNLRSVYIRANYEGIAKDIVYALKFDGARAASETIAALSAPLLPEDYLALIVPIPTANNRRRQRGFDQAELIARELQKRTGFGLSKIINRSGAARQVGAGRLQRRQQLEKAFWLRQTSDVRDKTVLLVDDVVTTGATLEAAASLLRDAGAKHVDALLFAQA